MLHINLIPFAAFLIALLLGFLFTPTAAKVGVRFGALDRPNARKVHTGNIPRSGGLAIIAAFALGHLFLLLVGSALDSFTLNWGFCGIFWTGALCSAGIGIIDDFKRVPSSVKLIMQVLAASIAFVGGVRIETFAIMQTSWHFPLIASCLLTVFWFVLLINAINLIDGLNGLAAGVIVFGAAVMAILMVISGNEKGAIAFAAVAGATLGFLRYNFNPARIFMGDGGSYFLGYALACFSIQYSAKSEMGLSSLLIPLLALGVPIFDVILSTVRRFITGNRIFKADKGHIHHKLLAMGLTTKRAVLILYGVSAVLPAAALFLVNIRSEQSGFIFLFLGLGAIVFVRKLGYFEYLALDKLFGWLHDITDVSGFTHSRRAFLGLEINIRESKTLEEMWRHACTAMEMKRFQRGYLVLNDQTPPILPDGGLHLHAVGESEAKTAGQRIWHYITKSKKDQHQIPQELKFEITLPLLTKHNTSLGILYLARDLQKDPLTTQTMRRIESLRRSLVIAIEKLETANKNQKRKEVDVKGVPKKTGSSAK